MRCIFNLSLPRLAAAAVIAASAVPAHAQFYVGDLPGAGATSLGVMSWKEIPFRSVVRQQYDYSCGSAALATLLRYHYGVATDEARIFRAMYEAGDQPKIRKVGFSLLDMKHYLAARGMSADGYRATYAQIEGLKQPAIAVVSVGRYSHFVVIKGIDDVKVLVGDPAAGLKTYPRKGFEAIWNGIVFTIHDNDRVKGVFNQASEWRPWAAAPLGSALDPQDLGFIRDLPPVYQVTQLRTEP